MGLWRRPTPPWAQELLCQMVQLNLEAAVGAVTATIPPAPPAPSS